MEKKELNRRKFISSSVLGVAGIGLMNTKGLAQEKKKEVDVKIKAFRKLGKTGFMASDISIGAPLNEAILQNLLEKGVNYIDTAESYGNGNSEKVTGKVIKNFDRKKLFITTKLAMKKDVSKEGFLKRARQCLKRLNTDYIDCLMLHSAPTVKSIKTEGFHQAADQLKKEGKLKFVGISNHGSQFGKAENTMEEVLTAAANDGRFDVMLLVYNFIQTKPAERIMKLCRQKNIGVTLMKTNPVGQYQGMNERFLKMKKEGKKIPPFFAKILPAMKAKAELGKEYIKKHNLKNPAEIRDGAIKFVLANKDVQSVCMSIRTFEEIDNNIKLSGESLKQSDKKKLAAYKQGFGDLYCRHACGICETSCPSNIPVNTIMRYNHYFDAQGREKHAMEKYAKLKDRNAGSCQDCDGHCMKACPYNVPVQGLLTLAHESLTLT